ncbi:MAG TPA: nucleotidyltransferase domain-containing protein [Kiritimatiellia bacterium]|nr:nucleotidyltransferase domain-containing protein [Kiritimatiellia bacterium]HMO98119.1 nucleotidyltransferase domain-containing protein [Kiritimatiellia bacterium]HMP96176.1 nucleotidyltransferase domain-containing protein [Kiritimatiellia bacterium]
MNVLAQLVCSRVRAEIFRILFGLRGGEVHLRDLQRQTGFTIGTVRQDIEKLNILGIVSRRRNGNRLYYSANKNHPLYPDIHQLVLKTIGLADVLGDVLAVDGIRCAFVFGSVAGDTAGADSDIDLMVIGSISLRKLSSLLSGLSDRLGREINPHVITAEDFSRRLRENDHFVTSVMDSEKIFVVGSPNELKTMGN